MKLPTEIDGVSVVPVRISSHRSRERLDRLVGGKAQCFFRYVRTGTAFVYLVPAGLAEKAASIKGVSLARKWDDDDEWSLPWSMADLGHCEMQP